MDMKKASVLKTFARMFAIFILLTVVTSALANYVLLKRLYYNNYMELLGKVNDDMITRFEADIDDFATLQDYFMKHFKEFKLPYKYPDNTKAEEKAFLKAFSEKYPGKTYGLDVQFADLDEDVKLLYARYKYLDWLLTFDRLKEDYHLDYAYYVVPIEKEGYVCYMFDGPRDKEEVDGKEQLLLGYEMFEDRNEHLNMWKAFEDGKPSGEMDVYDNEFGHVYTYSTPLMKDGKAIGIMMTDVSFPFVATMIRNAVLTNTALYLLVLGLFSVVMISIVRKTMISRIEKLEKQVEEYAENKDHSIAAKIKEDVKVDDEIGALSNGFGDMITELYTHMENLQKITAEKERIGAELNVATDIQASMLPRLFPAFPERDDFDLYASMDPAKEVGGDFYDFFMIDDDHLGLVMADVSGKGVPAALFMAISKVLIKDNALITPDPAAVLGNVNNQLCEDNDAGLFVTVWFGILDLKTHIMTFVDAGHENPFIIRANGEVEEIHPNRKRPPVATIEDIPYQNNEVKLEVGDMFFVYTDGVPEATNANEELFGMERLKKVMNDCVGMSAQELLPAVRAEVDNFVQDAEQFDDLTMLAFRLLFDKNDE